MAIKAYVGIMGSGKTFEVASVVILGALRDGRRVVSNIAGLNPDVYREILEAEGVEPDRIGQIVTVSHDAVLEPFFFRTDKDQAEGIDSFILPGDLVALDEIWRFWDGFSKPPERFMNFVRMHRQFVHSESGLTCELVLITQDVMDIGRKVRAVIEQTYRMEKATAVGSSKRYRVDIFTGGKVRGAPLRQLFKTYEAKYFPLYQSHSQKVAGSVDAVEKSIDGRGNILRGALFKIVLPLVLLFGAVGIYFVWGFFHRETVPPKSDSLVSSAPVVTSVSKKVLPADSAVSSEWRVYGWFTGRSGMVAILQHNDGRLRHEYMPSNMRIHGLTASLSLEDSRVTNYSGQPRLVRSDHEFKFIKRGKQSQIGPAVFCFLTGARRLDIHDTRDARVHSGDIQRTAGFK